MNNVDARFNLAIALSGDNSDGSESELGSATDSVSVSAGVALAHGTGANQANIIFHDRISVTASETLVLNDGSLKDAFGTGLVLTKLKALYIKNRTGGNLTIGNAGVAALPIFGGDTETMILKPDGEFLYIAPDASGLAVDGDNDELKIAHDAGGAQNVDVIIVGIN